MKLSDIKNKTRTLTIQIDEEELVVEYRPNALNMKFLEEIEDYGKEAVFHQIEAYVKSWSLEDEAGRMIEPTVENLKELPLNLLQVVLERIVDDQKGWSKDAKKA